jgi:hypothetical protein
MNRQINRNDIIRDIRYILAKHAADLQKCQFSCSTDILTVFGVLKKAPKGEFAMHGVIGLCRELKDVMFKFDNWQIDSNLTSVLHTEKKSIGMEGEDQAQAEEETVKKQDDKSDDDDTFRIVKKDITKGIKMPDDDMFL